MAGALLSLAVGATFAVSGAIFHDGDTAWTPEGSIRLFGVNAPECKVAHDKDHPCNDEATHVANNIVAGREIRCRVMGRSHDRVVGWCFTPDDRDIGRELLQMGEVCREAEYDPNGQYKEFHVCTADEEQWRRQFRADEDRAFMGKLRQFEQERDAAGLPVPEPRLTPPPAPRLPPKPAKPPGTVTVTPGRGEI